MALASPGEGSSPSRPPPQRACAAGIFSRLQRILFWCFRSQIRSAKGGKKERILGPLSSFRVSEGPKPATLRKPCMPRQPKGRPNVKKSVKQKSTLIRHVIQPYSAHTLIHSGPQGGPLLRSVVEQTVRQGHFAILQQADPGCKMKLNSRVSAAFIPVLLQLALFV